MSYSGRSYRPHQRHFRRHRRERFHDPCCPPKRSLLDRIKDRVQTQALLLMMGRVFESIQSRAFRRQWEKTDHAFQRYCARRRQKAGCCCGE